MLSLYYNLQPQQLAVAVVYMYMIGGLLVTV